jgi:hypothetical protein
MYGTKKIASAMFGWLPVMPVSAIKLMVRAFAMLTLFGSLVSPSIPIFRCQSASFHNLSPHLHQIRLEQYDRVAGS